MAYRFGRTLGESIAIKHDGHVIATIMVEKIGDDGVDGIAYLECESEQGYSIGRGEVVNGTVIAPPGGKDVMTTTQVAKLLRVAPRTVSKWFDTGKLKGYRVQADRRIPWSNVVAFAREHGIPIEEYMSTAV